MKGFLKMPAADFDAWNATAATNYITKTGDTSCGAVYTSARLDADASFVWARVEHDFVEGDIKTKEEASELGMLEEVLPQE